jgi:hypothetical protein
LKRGGRVKGRVLGAVIGIAGIAVLAFALTAVRVWQFRDRYVMVTVEESSTSAVTSWPLLAEKLPGSFLDPSSKTLSVAEKPGMLGVSLCLHYSATSQGIEIADSLRFSKTGKASLGLDQPLSYLSDTLDGGQIELVDNRARVLAGSLRIEGTSTDGTVRLLYGDRRFALEPGQSFAELLALTPDGLKVVDPTNWEAEFGGYLEKGYPTTRLAITNRGFWPKSGILAGMEP